MTKVHHVKKARKSYPKAGIKKGSPYWWTSTKRNGRFTGKQRWKVKPRRSQLTGSEYLAAIYGAREALEDAANALGAAAQDNDVDEDGGLAPNGNDADGAEDEVGTALEAFADAVERAAEDVRQAGEECGTKRDNMPDGLRDGDVGQLLERRAEACEALALELDNLVADVRGTDASELTAGFADEKLGGVDWSEAEE